jgi:uncharacterized Zn finger protein
MKDTPTLICPNCGCSDNVVDKNAPHRCHWSRKTINTLECKVCGKVATRKEIYGEE